MRERGNIIIESFARYIYIYIRKKSSSSSISPTHHCLISNKKKKKKVGGKKPFYGQWIGYILEQQWGGKKGRN